jgi:DNA-binding NtrC family response regulator
MKYALLFDEDPSARRHSAALLKSLGYLVAETATVDAALNAMRALHFDVILTAASCMPGDRRTLPGELQHYAPDTPTILLLAEDAAMPPIYTRFSATLSKPVTVRSLRHALEFGLDGTGAHAVPMMRQERRHDGARRQQLRTAPACPSRSNADA